jgi:hypothetical protein
MTRFPLLTLGVRRRFEPLFESARDGCQLLMIGVGW